MKSTFRAPIPFEPELASDALAIFASQPENIKNLIGGTAGCSPYLRGLLLQESEWLATVFETDPALVLKGIQADVTARTYDVLAVELRQAKRRIALYTALCDLGGMWDLGQVTGALTDFADFATNTALNALILAEFERGKLLGCTVGDLQEACGMVVLAMGKMGARELNYSSDIDLIVLFDETRHAEAVFDDIRTRFIRITKRLAQILSDVTGDGYVFRTDLRLRPDPSVTPVCLSMGAAERYYESLGRTWERAAFIKARPCAGDIKAGWDFLETLRPFVWRKHLDYAAIQDAHDMRLRIREHKGLGGPIQLQGHNMKLGRGGIREIEFFTQTRQIIAGGRDPELRSRQTIGGLKVLAAKGWIPPEASDRLSAAYVQHRTIEHRIQMLNDAQTHDLPNSLDQMRRLANFCGQADVVVFCADIRQRLNMVHDLTESFFAPEQETAPQTSGLSAQSLEMIDRWRHYPALRTSRAVGIFKRLQPSILARIARAAHPDEALIQFDGFLSGLPAGVQLFSMFDSNPQLIDLLVDICGSAPGLARYLSRNSQVFDAVIAGTFFEVLPAMDDLVAELAAVLTPLDDYENQLNAARRWMKELHFRIGVQHLKGMIQSETAGARYSDLAEACLRALLPVVAQEFARKHGDMPGRGAVVLGMGSLGSGSLSATSDLDVIVIYDADGQETSTGARPLAVSTYFARLTQALVTALSSPMTEGRLYEVDMRLRPSGRKGPVATALSGFVSYQRTEAWTWEHLALTRARPVAGDQGLAAEVEAFRREIVAQQRDHAVVLHDVADMRARLSDAADVSRLNNPWETKLGQGRMLDIELLAQAAALTAGNPARDVLVQLALGVSLGWYKADECKALQQAYGRLRRVQQIGRLMVEGELKPTELGLDACAELLNQSGAASIVDLGEKLLNEATLVSGLIDAVLGRAKA